MDQAFFCLSVPLSIKYDSVCQVISEMPGRDSAPSHCVPAFIKWH